MPAFLCFPVLLSVLLLCAFPQAVQADGDARRETRVEQVRNRFGLTGDGVIVAILDRGIDYEHPDFRNPDGTSRILYILDLTDNTGANDPDNTVGAGTLYTKEQIDAALASDTRLATRDAVGHGTTTAGLAGGNGRASDGRYAGMAPEASFIIVKFVTEGAPAHDGEPAEDPFYQPALFPDALDFVIEKADEVDLPFVALANFGSVGAISDGTSYLARAIDARFGPERTGRVFVTGTSDDGAQPNHAAGTIGAGETVALRINKGHSGNLRLRLWYDGADRLDAEIVTPSGTFGPYTSPPTNTDRDAQQDTGFRYFHNGSDVDFAQATSNTREILIDISGPVGDYVLRLTGATVADGRFHAWLNPSRIFAGSENRFESFMAPGHTVWDMAAAEHNIAPNSYVLRHEWQDIDGNRRSVSDEGAIGDLWIGSGIGPTVDGRFGVTVSAPGEKLFAPYAPRSNFARGRGNLVYDGGNGGLYGLQSAVSAAAPVTTGIVALLLEADPTLDAAEIKDIIQRTARQDGFTGEAPNNEWGYGKIDALAAVAEVLGVEVNAAPSTAQLTSPEDGAEIVVGGAPGEDPLDPSQTLMVAWSAAEDPEGEPVTYTWQLAATDTFTDVLLSQHAGGATTISLTLETLAETLDAVGLTLGDATTLYHRVVVSDGINETAGMPASVTFTRGTLTSVDTASGVPDHYALATAYPNPFNPTTTIGYGLPEAAAVRLVVYDVLGRQVAVLVDGMRPAGRHQAVFEAANLPSGVYLYQLQAGTPGSGLGQAFIQTRRMLLVK